MTENQQQDGHTKLAGMVDELGKLRADLQWFENHEQKAKEKLHETEAFKTHIRAQGSLKGQKDAIDECAEAIKELVAELALETGDKKPSEFVEARSKTTFSITDENAVMEWAKAHTPMLVKETLDAKTFKTIYLAMGDEQRLGIPGVTCETSEIGEIRILWKALDEAYKQETKDG